MKGSLLIIGCFAAGCLLGWCGWLTDGVITRIDNSSEYVLFLLMFLVGMGIGSDRKLPDMLRSVTPKFLLVPLSTIVGTVIGSVIVSFFISHWTTSQCLAVGCGFGYYSLSSILITQLAASSIGVQAATELGTVALIANIIRELSVLVFAPLIVRFFGRFAPICAGGVRMMDTTLPVITKYAGKDIVFISIMHAILIDFSVPVFVSFFISL